MSAFFPSLPDLRPQLGAQVDFLTQVSQHAIDIARQLSELNKQAARSGSSAVTAGAGDVGAAHNPT